jgi:trans-2,3-dihydro-3-hydroxyanthranilate isomerase
MPFAGHPNVGTAFVLAHQDRVCGVPFDRGNMIFEEIAGLVRMTIDTVDGLVAGASLAAPQQFRIIRDFDVAMIAQACSLEPSDIEVRRHPPCLASCGAPFVIAEVRDRAALRRAQQRMDVFLSHLPRDEVTGIHLYVEEAEEGADFQSRMFAPLHGVFEDPATGSANVALIGLLAHLRPESSLRLKAAIGQGVDLGRPSLLRAVAEKVDGAVTETFIGGGCKPVMSGWIDLQ